MTSNASDIELPSSASTLLTTGERDALQTLLAAKQKDVVPNEQLFSRGAGILATGVSIAATIGGTYFCSRMLKKAGVTLPSATVIAQDTTNFLKRIGPIGSFALGVFPGIPLALAGVSGLTAGGFMAYGAADVVYSSTQSFISTAINRSQISEGDRMAASLKGNSNLPSLLKKLEDNPTLYHRATENAHINTSFHDQKPIGLLQDLNLADNAGHLIPASTPARATSAPAILHT